MLGVICEMVELALTWDPLSGPALFPEQHAVFHIELVSQRSEVSVFVL